MIPNFNELGDLPMGIHSASLDEIKERFGGGSPQREKITNQLLEVIHLARSTGHLQEAFIFGSYVTVKTDRMTLIYLSSRVLNLTAMMFQHLPRVK